MDNIICGVIIYAFARNACITFVIPDMIRNLINYIGVFLRLRLNCRQSCQGRNGKDVRVTSERLWMVGEDVRVTSERHCMVASSVWVTLEGLWMLELKTKGWYVSKPWPV